MVFNTDATSLHKLGAKLKNPRRCSKLLKDTQVRRCVTCDSWHGTSPSVMLYVFGQEMQQRQTTIPRTGYDVYDYKGLASIDAIPAFVQAGSFGAAAVP